MNKFYIIFILIIVFTAPLFSMDGDSWKMSTDAEKIVFVDGMKSGLGVGVYNNHETYNSIREKLPRTERNQKTESAFEVYMTLSDLFLSVYYENFERDFINYLDDYFENTDNGSAAYAFRVFMKDRIDSRTE